MKDFFPSIVFVLVNLQLAFMPSCQAVPGSLLQKYFYLYCNIDLVCFQAAAFAMVLLMMKRYLYAQGAAKIFAMCLIVLSGLPLLASIIMKASWLAAGN